MKKKASTGADDTASAGTATTATATTQTWRSSAAAEIRGRSEVWLSGLAGQCLAKVVQFVARPAGAENGASKEGQERLAARFRSIRSPEQLRKEVKALGKTLRAAAPKSATDLEGIFEFRSKVTKKLIGATRAERLQPESVSFASEMPASSPLPLPSEESAPETHFEQIPS